MPLLHIRNEADTGWLAVGAVVNTFPTGTKMYFYQASAPNGWTIDNTLGDKVLAVHGTSPYGGSTGGGQQKGGWAITGCSVANHTLTVSEIPSHYHYGLGQRYSGSGYFSCSGAGNPGNAPTPYTGGGGAHSHGFNADGTWRPFANVGIIATKD